MPRKSKRGQTKRATNTQEERQYHAAHKPRVSGKGAPRVAAPSRKIAARRAPEAPKYEDWSRQDLYAQARRLGVQGRSHMKKRELIDALRSR